MILQSELCTIKIELDDTYAVGSKDNRPYDIELNPFNLTRSGSYAHSIAVDLFYKEYKIALVSNSPVCSSDDIATLCCDILTIMQNQVITQIDITSGKMVRYAELDTVGDNYSIYNFNDGFIIHGEYEITMLNSRLEKQWSFRGNDAFVAHGDKSSFEIKEDRICLYDFEDTYYEIDFDGKVL